MNHLIPILIPIHVNLILIQLLTVEITKMNYKDERIKDALANVESKNEILDEAKKAHYEALNKLAKTTENITSKVIVGIPSEIYKILVNASPGTYRT